MFIDFRQMSTLNSLGSSTGKAASTNTSEVIVQRCLGIFSSSALQPACFSYKLTCESLFVCNLCLSGIRLEFIKPIKDVTVKERETAEFSVELSHEKIPVVWYKNDIRLHPSKVVHISEDRKVHTLAFKEVTIDDTSMIKVEAMGKTSEAMLTVLG